MTDILSEINKLKQEKNAVILAHYYAPKEAQKIADYVGDSFYLAKIAVSLKADTVVFCGVKFMGESVKILNKEKKVLMPDISADCAMAHMADKNKIAELRKQYSDLAVVCYINSTAELKCLSDVCVTSSNALKIVNALESKNIFFIPDKNLGSFIKEKVKDKNIILNDGFCPIHEKQSAEDLKNLKAEHKDALVLSHPECKKEVLELSDFIGSTLDIINYSKSSAHKKFIICTESGVSYTLEKDSPEKTFIYAFEDNICADMKLNTLENIKHVLETGENEISVPDETAEKAKKPLDRMLELAK